GEGRSTPRLRGSRSRQRGVGGGHGVRGEQGAAEDRRGSPPLRVRKAGTGGRGEVPLARQEPERRGGPGDHARAGHPQAGSSPMSTTRSGSEGKPVYGPGHGGQPPPPPGADH